MPPPLDIAVTVARSAEIVGVAVTAASLGNARCRWLLLLHNRRGRGSGSRCRRSGRRRDDRRWRRHRRSRRSQVRRTAGEGAEAEWQSDAPRLRELHESSLRYPNSE